MYKKCFPSSASSDLPPTTMSKKRKAEEQKVPKIIKHRKTTESKTPLCPKAMATDYSHIDVHPNYKLLDSSTRFAYEVACKQGYSHRNNNKFVRDIWAKLYLNKHIQNPVVFDRKKPEIQRALDDEFEEVEVKKEKLNKK